MKWVIAKWLELARNFPIVRRIPILGAGIHHEEHEGHEDEENHIDRSGGA